MELSIQELFLVGMKRHIPHLKPDYQGTHYAILNLGPGHSYIKDAINLDYPDWDADLGYIPFPDESVAQIHAYHFLEHCKDPVQILKECQRVLTTGGHMNIVVPYYSVKLQAQDLDHKHAFCEDTWKILFNNAYYDKNVFEWKFEIRFNIIIGIVEHNLCLMTQLVKRL